MKISIKFGTKEQDMLLGMGNGDLNAACASILDLSKTIAIARQKHPEWPGKGRLWAFGELEKEMQELEHALLHESPARQREELLDVLAVAWRMLMREYEEKN